MLLILVVLLINFDGLSLGIYRSKKGGGFSLLETRESKYGRIEVLKNPRANQYLVFHNSALVSSIEPEVEDQYEQQLAEICLTQHPGPGRVLLILLHIGKKADQVHGYMRLTWWVQGLGPF